MKNLCLFQLVIIIGLVIIMSDDLLYFEKKDKYVVHTPATIKWWQCTRKRPYTSIKQATNTMRKYNGNKKDVHVYECPHCYQYHIGHKPQKRK